MTLFPFAIPNILAITDYVQLVLSVSFFGVMHGEELIVKGCSLAKQTMEIKVGSTLIALRADEADKIEVEKLQGRGGEI